MSNVCRADRSAPGRWWRARVVVAALTTVSLTAGGLAEAQQPEPPGFADGVWDGTLRFIGSADLPTTAATAAVLGEFEMEVIAGIITHGFFSTEGTGFGFADFGGTGTLDALMEGDVTGTARVLSLVPTEAWLTGSINVSGLISPVNAQLEAEDLETIPLTITSASCSIVSGTWTFRLGEAAASSGGSAAATQDSWVATWRKDAAASVDPNLQLAVDQLLDEAAAFQASVAGKLFPWGEGGLAELFRRADELALSIPLNTGCGIGPPGGFSSALATMVEDLLLVLVNDLGPGVVPIWGYLRAVIAGVHTGVLGSGSTSVYAGQITDGISTALSGALKYHVEEGYGEYTLAEIYQITLIAETLGDAALLAEAMTVYQETEAAAGSGASGP